VRQTENAEPSRFLSTGTHLVEVVFERPLLRSTLEKALLQMGFGASSVDESVRLQGGQIAAGTSVLFIGKLSRPLRLVDTSDVRWIGSRDLVTDPFAPLRYDLTPYVIDEGRSYEIRFIARMKAHPGRKEVEDVLRAMHGFEVDKLMALQKDTRIPECPGTSVTVWFGIARWFGPRSPVNMDDPVSFEEVKEMHDA